MPLFSFVIPTRNRARYLKLALQSCLEQDFDDYELVISDNNSSDDTKKVVEHLDNGRVRYFNTGKDVDVTENFDNAITNARGEYVLMLADDEAYKVSALSKLKFWIDQTDASVISFGRTPFVFPGMARYGFSEEENTSGILALRPFTRKVAWVPSSHVLETAFSLIQFEEYYYSRAFPLSVKSMIRRDVVNAITNSVGRFHLPPTPDWSSAIMILNHVDRVLLLDEHLHLAGELPVSSGPNFKKNRQSSGVENSDPFYFTDLTPLKSHTLTNIVVNAILHGQEAYPGKNKFELDYSRYFRLIENDLRNYRNNGLDVEKDFEELTRVSKEYGILPDATMPLFNRLIAKMNSFLKKMQSHLSPVEAISPGHSHWPIVMNGKVAGFSNIFECARNFDSLTTDIYPDEHALSLFEAAYGSCEVIG